LHCAIQSKKLKNKKKKEKKKTKAYAMGNFFFLHKKYQKMLRSKSVRSFCKDIPKALGLATTLDPKILFIILIITLNLYNLSLSEFDCNTGP